MSDRNIRHVAALEKAYDALERAIPSLEGTTLSRKGVEAAVAAYLGAIGSTGAEAVIDWWRIEISIDVSALPVILSGSLAVRNADPLYRVTDAHAFAAELVLALNHEDEDGSTVVHKMFDAAMDEAIDQGAEGVEEIDEEAFEAEIARLLRGLTPGLSGPASEQGDG